MIDKRFCPWCGVRFQPMHRGQRYCCTKHSREMRRARRRDDNMLPIIDVLKAELEMMTWEGNLPDPPPPMGVVTVEGKLAPSAIKRLKEFVEKRMLGGTKDEVLILEGVPNDKQLADFIRFRYDETTQKGYDKLMDEYLEGEEVPNAVCQKCGNTVPRIPNDWKNGKKFYVIPKGWDLEEFTGELCCPDCVKPFEYDENMNPIKNKKR